jgi:hypothetical protein
MSSYTRTKEMKWFCFLCCFVLCLVVGGVAGEPVDTEEPTRTEAQIKLEEKAKEEQRVEGKIFAEEISAEQIAQLDLPEDVTPLMAAKELRIVGNSLITTEELLSNIPLIYSTVISLH